MKRKYLDDIGVTDRPDTLLAGDSREPAWAEQRDIYGFDARETWNLDQTFYLWLYERLMMFKEKAEPVVDLDFNRFDYDGKECTQKDLINGMLERLKFSFSEEYDDYKSDQWEYVHEIEKMWAVVLPSMWW